MFQDRIADQQIEAAVANRQTLPVVKNDLYAIRFSRIHSLGFVAADVVNRDVLARNIQVQLVPEVARTTEIADAHSPNVGEPSIQEATTAAPKVLGNRVNHAMP